MVPRNGRALKCSHARRAFCNCVTDIVHCVNCCVYHLIFQSARPPLPICWTTSLVLLVGSALMTYVFATRVAKTMLIFQTMSDISDHVKFLNDFFQFSQVKERLV